MKSQKVKVVLQNLKLIDVPARQNRIFVKVKHGSFHYTTKPYQIVKSVVNFLEPVTIEMTIPNDPKKAKAIKCARLSFRLENTSGSGFTRYGIVMLNIIQRLFANELDVRSGLENCTEKPVFMCNIQMPSNFNFPIQQGILIDETDLSSGSVSVSNSVSTSMSTQFKKNSIKGNHVRISSVASKPALFDELSDRTEPMSVAPKMNFTQSRRKSQIHVSNSFDSLAENLVHRRMSVLQMSGENSLLSNQSSSTIQKANLYENAPAKISKERFKKLEEQVDNLLAGIIINN